MKKTTKKKEYTATAIIMGKKFTGKGETVSDAVSKIKIGNCKGKVILVVSNGKDKKEKVMNPMQMNKLFNSHGLMKEIALKNISIIFSGL